MQTTSNVEYILINDANVEPLNLNEVKSHLRLDGNSSFDTQLNNLIKVARQYCEKITGRDLINKNYRALLNCMPTKIKIQKSKLQSITSIQYYKDNVLETLPSNQYYFTYSNDYSLLIIEKQNDFIYYNSFISINFRKQKKPNIHIVYKILPIPLIHKTLNTKVEEIFLILSVI